MRGKRGREVEKGKEEDNEEEEEEDEKGREEKRREERRMEKTSGAHLGSPSSPKTSWKYLGPLLGLLGCIF